MMVLPGFKKLLTVTLLGAAACSTLPPAAKDFDNFSDYVESVFRHQNLLSSRLMMLSEAMAENETLEDAEQDMNDACHLLNEYADHEMSGESMGLFFKRRVKASIEECDKKIHILEALLPKNDP
ncbi:hypothetical protein NP590_03405 [Methylomonas sp. SURF-2]|uniref:Lipoprotein n=1 Tax=Methylomonas subterranea TaxID=2952225 RepID=A0ABT1TEF4_9GAMM|nr:hypothetical protein [Methylomonas sp. SURF-2]MCQ8103144.1 hypothetical protein [Methylomonas sp. SURF-2]